jgi:hypothetical protein
MQDTTHIAGFLVTAVFLTGKVEAAGICKHNKQHIENRRQNNNKTYF